jgi:hypothetical protein
LAQQFTLQGAVVIDRIDLVVSAPVATFTSSTYPFSAEIENTLGNPTIGGTFVGSGALAVPSNGNYTTELFDFSGLNIPLGTGTYYLVVQGGNVEWNYAPALATSSGSLGHFYSCDPSLNCTPGRWDANTSGATFAVDIDGTAVTPEPSSWLLFGTGLLTAGFFGRRQFLCRTTACLATPSPARDSRSA